jgi:hypothetical protein
MEIIGYSERGMINSLFYELKISENYLRLLNDFLSLVSFPDSGVTFQVSEVKILIEQSFSDFGAPDAVILVNNHGVKQVIFIEAKVKTEEASRWEISKEFEKFRSGIAKPKPPKGYSSNLFVQLYFKTRLIKELKSGGVKQLQEGVKFTECLLKMNRTTHKRIEKRKIGTNKIVLKAVEELKGYCNNALFIALLPDDISNLKDFHQVTLREYRPEGFQEWDVGNWGYLSWNQVEEFCKRNNLKETVRNFEFNEGQIYNSYLSPTKNISSQEWSRENVFELMNKLNEKQRKLMEILVEGNGKEKQGVILQKLGSLGGKGNPRSLKNIEMGINQKSVCGKLLPKGYGSGENKIHRIEPNAYVWVKEWIKTRDGRT